MKILDSDKHLKHNVLRFTFEEPIGCLDVTYDVTEKVTARAELQKYVSRTYEPT